MFVELPREGQPPTHPPLQIRIHPLLATAPLPLQSCLPPLNTVDKVRIDIRRGQKECPMLVFSKKLYTY